MAALSFEDVKKNLSLGDNYQVQDISMEEYREYVHVPSGAVYRIDQPVALITRTGGTTHRVVTSSGLVHCVPFGGPSPYVLRWMNCGSNPCQF